LEGQGDYKDKAIDLKVQFYPEGKYMPALALGIMDPYGTRIYPSQYIAASKQIYPFDFTIGYGNGRFGTEPLTARTENFEIEMFSDPKSWFEESQLFGGIQFAPSEKFALMVEYSPIKYDKQTTDPALRKYFAEPVPSKFNFGVRYKPTKWSEIDLSYQRGNQIGVNFSAVFDIGEPWLPIYDPVYKEQAYDRADSVQNRLTRALHNSGFSDIGIFIDDDVLWIEAQNDKYFYNTRAIGVVLQIIANMTSDDIDGVYVVLKENGIPIIELSTSLEDILLLHAEQLTLNEFLYVSNLRTDVPESEN
jgi:hypothetical protein